jgi:putative ABC transport system permease protein
MARDLTHPAQSLPLLAEPLPVPPGQVGIYVSEAVIDLHAATLGKTFQPLSDALTPLTIQTAGRSTAAPVFYVAGIWRDYARQSGTIALDKAAFERLTGDQRANDLALWLKDGTPTQDVEQGLRLLANQDGQAAGQLLEFGTSRQIRATSLRIFDRSFAVTYWLQAVAIGMGLFGVAASFSAQVLARRKEFGLLVHLGFTRRQILGVVALEGLAWTSLGALAGLGLGLAVAVVLVHVVNPQSFHWTMDLMLPMTRLLGLCLAVVVAGTLTDWLAGRAAAGQDAVLAVKEDW